MTKMELSDLDTTIAFYGHAAGDEIGGPPCLAVFVGILVGSGNTDPRDPPPTF
ncbi:hypothetical protein [Sphingomonas sp. Leaf33]|uniref:hypothetical protein n=1 Tax=Sphingomonas sp. Leaf33 TaxID=1736215 RepID=UPI000AB71A82|nr:hypothetical protein [Sphingomonas sp. Leaf33]